MLDATTISEMSKALDKASAQMDFEPLVEGVRAILNRSGIEFDRLQLPMTKPLGFRHPTFWGVLLTWSKRDHATNRSVVTHDEAIRNGLPGASNGPDPVLDEDDIRTPYYFVLGEAVLFPWASGCSLHTPSEWIIYLPGKRGFTTPESPSEEASSNNHL